MPIRYSVKGWSIQQAKTADAANGQWKEGDILYDVRFERSDPVPMSEALRRPTATEIDDYLEYKRLRKLYKVGRRNMTTADFDILDETVPTRRAPAVPPLQPSVSPMTLQDSIFKKPPPDKKTHVRFPMPSNAMSTLPNHDNEAPSFTKRGGSLLEVPLRSGIRLPSSNPGQTSVPESPSGSQASSLHTGTSTISHIKKVAPWIDYDANLTLPEPSQELPVVRDRMFSQSTKASRTQRRDMESRSPSPRPRPGPVPAPSPLANFRDRKKSANAKDLDVQRAAKKDGRRFTTLRARGPIAKLFDGSLEDKEQAAVADDWFDRDAICPPSEWDLVSRAEAMPGEEARILLDDFVNVSFVDPFSGKARKVEGRRDSVRIAPDEDAAGS